MHERWRDYPATWLSVLPSHCVFSSGPGIGKYPSHSNMYTQIFWHLNPLWWLLLFTITIYKCKRIQFIKWPESKINDHHPLPQWQTNWHILLTYSRSFAYFYWKCLESRLVNRTHTCMNIFCVFMYVGWICTSTPLYQTPILHYFNKAFSVVSHMWLQCQSTSVTYCLDLFTI